MSDKRMLSHDTDRYESLPAWLAILCACLMIIVFYLVGELVGGVVMSILSLPLLSLNEPLAEVWFSSLYYSLLTFFFIALTVFAWVRWYEQRSIRTLGFFKDGWLLAVVKGWGVGMLTFSCAFFLTYVFGGVALKQVDLSMNSVLYVISTTPFWFIQGGTEELLTRGWLLPIIYKRTNLAVAVGVSSSLFGLMHLANDHVTVFSIFGIILSGIFMALYMLKTDNLWGVAGLHGAWNFTQGNIFGVAVSGTGAGQSLFTFGNKAGAAQWISGGAFGTEGSLLTSLVLLIGIIILALLLNKENKNKEG